MVNKMLWAPGHPEAFNLDSGSACAGHRAARAFGQTHSGDEMGRIDRDRSTAPSALGSGMTEIA